MKRLKAGVIGLGIGEQHVLDYRAHPQCDVVAVCDGSEAKRAEATDAYPGVRVMAEASELIDDPEIDVVSIASYDDDHYEQVMRCVEKDKHMVVEKPLCQYASQMKDIRAALAAKPHVKLTSSLVLRLSSRFRAVKRMIEGGEMGEVFYVEGDYNYGRLHKITEGWRGNLDDYSVMCGGGVHMVDLLLWLTGDSVVNVMAYGNGIASKASGFAGPDMVTCVLKFKSGLVGKVAANFGCVMPHYHGVSVYGTQATFVNGPDEGRLYRSREKGERGAPVSEPYKDYRRPDLMVSFLDAILTGSEPLVKSADVFNAMAVCFAADKSLATGLPVDCAEEAVT
jgi:predicted dehydrogenase